MTAPNIILFAFVVAITLAITFIPVTVNANGQPYTNHTRLSGKTSNLSRSDEQRKKERR
jgi:hypothetical protein